MQRGAQWISEGDNYFRISFFEEHSCSGQCSAGADRADESINFSVGLLIYFGSSGFEVALSVCGVIKLIGPDRSVWFGLRQFFGEASGNLDVIIFIAIGHCRNFPQIRSAQPQHIFFFLTLRFRNHNHGTVSQGISDQRQTDSGVTRGSFNDHPART